MEAPNKRKAMTEGLQCFGIGKKSKKERIPFAEDVVNLVAEIRKIPVGANVEELFLFELLLNANYTLYHIWGISLMDKNKYSDLDSLEIHIIPDEKNNTLSIVDNGIGMSRRDLMTRFRSYEYPPRHLNTINKYLSCEAGANLSTYYNLERSEWGLGFFSAYMVADKVVVTTRMQGDDPFVWECVANDNIVSTFTVAAAAAPVDDSFVRGTKVTLHLKPGHDQYLRVDKLQELVNKYKRLRHFYPILVFPNGKNEPGGILLNEKKDEEPIENLKQQYEDIRLLFVEYVSERAKNVDVVLSDRPRMGVFCNLDVFEDVCKRPVLEINPRCPEMKVLRKMLECVGKFKE